MLLPPAGPSDRSWEGLRRPVPQSWAELHPPNSYAGALTHTTTPTTTPKLADSPYRPAPLPPVQVCGRCTGVGVGAHQAERLRQLHQGLLRALARELQLAQRVRVGPLAQPLRQGAQAHEVALLLPLLLHRRDVEALQGCGEAGCGEEAPEAASRPGGGGGSPRSSGSSGSRWGR